MEAIPAQTAEIKEMIEKTKLEYTWAIWENWSFEKEELSKDYLKTMQALAKFDNLIDFWQLWNTLPHSDPGKIFIQPGTSQQLQYFC